MSSFQRRRLLGVSLVAIMVSLPGYTHAQDSVIRGRKYVPPPNTARVSVAVVKDSNGKPVEHAAVIFHQIGQDNKGNMELKTNEDGKAIIDVIPIGDTVTLQVIASGFQTYGENHKIDANTKEIVVRLKRPAAQYSTYTQSGTPADSTPPAGAPRPGSAQPPPKQ